MTIQLVHNVYVVEEGLVFDSDLNLLAISKTQHSEGEIERGLGSIKKGVEADTIPRHSRIALLAKKRGVQNYGHWLMEMLPKIHLVRSQPGLANVPCVVADIAGAMGTVIDDSLSLLNITSNDVIKCGASPEYFNELLIVDGLTGHGVFMSPLVMGCMNDLAAKIPAESVDRLYVSRGSAARRIDQEQDVESMFTELGFQIVHPERLSVRSKTC